jgi:prepilin-type N-terminal cleavage/methylation domain-containing protein
MNAENKMLHGKRKGFSLVEILIVLVILAVISGGGMMIAGKSTEKSKYVTAQKDLDIIQQAFIQYYNVVGNYLGIADGADANLSAAFTGDTTSGTPRMNVLQSFFGKKLADWKDPWGVEYQVKGKFNSDGTGVLLVYCKNVEGTGTSVNATVGSVSITGMREDKISNANGKPMPMYRIIYNVDF